MKLFKVVIGDDETQGVYAIGLVDKPAIEVDAIKLSAEPDTISFNIELKADVARQIMYGPILIADKVIERNSNGERIGIVFDKETIGKIALKYNDMGIKSFNFNHTDQSVEAVLVESWIVDNPDKSEKWGYKLSEGSWFGGIYVKDKDFWNNYVETDKVNGFSVEVRCKLENFKLMADPEGDDNKNKLNLMNYNTKEGVVLAWEGDLVEGVEVYAIAEDGSETPASGDFTLEDGRVISIAEGKVVSIKSNEEMQEDVPTEMPDVEAKFEEFRNLIADLSSRLDALENKSETETEESLSKEKNLEDEVKELKETVENLSKIAGAPSVTKKSDVEIKKERAEQVLLQKIGFYQKYK